MQSTTTVLVASTALLLEACSYAVRAPLRTTEASTALEQVTRGTGEQQNPTLSPDAKLLAYEQRASATAPPHIQLVTLGAAAAPRDLPPGVEPTFMPDGSGLVLVAPARPAAQRDQLVQTIGDSALRPAFAAPLGDPYLSMSWPAVAPNGREVAIALVTTNVYEERTGKNEWLDPALAVTDLRGSGIVAIGPGTEPSWSPDGSRIAFIRRVGDRNHVFVARATKDAPALQIAEGADDDEAPTWSPDGSHIVFCSKPAGSFDSHGTNLFVMKSDGTELRQLTEGEADACRPAWGRDGHIYFHANEGGAYHVWRIALR